MVQANHLDRAKKYVPVSQWIPSTVIVAIGFLCAWYYTQIQKNKYSKVEQREEIEANAKAEAWKAVGLTVGEVQQHTAALAYSAAYPYLPQVEKGYLFGRLAAASEVPYPYNVIILKRIFNLTHDFIGALVTDATSSPESEREELKQRQMCLRELKQFKGDIERVSSAARDESSAAELTDIQRQLEPVYTEWKKKLTQAREKYPFITKEDLQKELKTSPSASRKTGFFYTS